MNHRHQFPHTFFGFTSAIAVMLLYIIGGSIVVSYPAIRDNHDLSRLLQAFGQIFFMLGSTLLVANLSPLGIRLLMRRDAPSFQLNYVGAMIVAVVAIQSLSIGWQSVLHAILPVDIMTWLNDVSAMSNEAIEVYLQGEGVTAFLRSVCIGAIIPAVCEEALFRGLLQRSIEERSGASVAITHSSIFFAALHLNPLQFLPLLCFGVLLGRIAYSSSSLLPSMLMHCLSNTFAVIVLFTPQLRSMDELSLQLPIGAALGACLIGLLGFTACWRMTSRK